MKRIFISLLFLFLSINVFAQIGTSRDRTKLRKTGDTMTGTLNMDRNNIINGLMGSFTVLYSSTIFECQIIEHINDPDTDITFADNRFTLKAGGLEAIDIFQDSNFINLGNAAWSLLRIGNFANYPSTYNYTTMNWIIPFGLEAGSITAAGNITADSFTGNGAGLTGTGDNFGNHKATTTIDMLLFDIINGKTAGFEFLSASTSIRTAELMGKNDPDTTLTFLTNRITMQAGGEEMIDMLQNLGRIEICAADTADNNAIFGQFNSYPTTFTCESHLWVFPFGIELSTIVMNSGGFIQLSDGTKLSSSPFSSVSSNKNTEVYFDAIDMNIVAHLNSATKYEPLFSVHGTTESIGKFIRYPDSDPCEASFNWTCSRQYDENGMNVYATIAASGTIATNDRFWLELGISSSSSFSTNDYTWYGSTTNMPKTLWENGFIISTWTITDIFDDGKNYKFKFRRVNEDNWPGNIYQKDAVIAYSID